MPTRCHVLDCESRPFESFYVLIYNIFLNVYSPSRLQPAGTDNNSYPHGAQRVYGHDSGAGVRWGILL